MAGGVSEGSGQLSEDEDARSKHFDNAVEDGEASPSEEDRNSNVPRTME